MKAKLTYPLKFKDGSDWFIGTEVIISVAEDHPMVAVLESNEQVRRIRSANLWRYFDEFIQVTDDLIEEGISDSVCESLTGERVEPDGWDSEGFPSVLLACGLM